MSPTTAQHPLWVLLGAECTGKSSLARAWTSAHAGWHCVDEYLREFCDTHQRTPRQDEQAHIAAEQTRRIDAALVHGPVIADTHAFQTAVYSRVLFGDDSLFADAAQHLKCAERIWVCQPDFAWVADGLQRDGPHVQRAVHEALRSALLDFGIAHAAVSGDLTQRMHQLAASVQH